jgi:two-component system CheB/CheR fusion protein
VTSLINSGSSHTPLCAIGASAGGVAALQEFFGSVKSDLGLAFIVIVHLSPSQPSALQEIIATRTQMPVVEVETSAELRPNCVYIIAPDRELVIEGDDLAANPFVAPRGRRSPIDTFFQSVGASRGDGIAILLSGTGSDGTLGVRAVKEAGGLVFAQDPREAEYGTMPENAIATGVVDFVGTIAALAERVAEAVRSKEALSRASREEVEQQVRAILTFLRLRTGHDFSNYKRATLLRRVARRMQITRQVNLGDYYKYLHSHPSEAQELFSDLLISVTMFFRDPQAFAALSESVIKVLFDRLADSDASIRVWVVGCATGEEAYSIGILLLEEAARRGMHPIIQIFATDIDGSALALAREGRYPRSIESSVSEARLKRFFTQDGPYYRVRQELRDLVLFSLHSALKDPPFIKVDLISCRNVLIYLQRDLQRQLCTLFHYALKQNGYIFLGSAETIETTPTLFTPVDRDARIYAALATLEKVAPVMPQLSPDRHFLEQPAKQRLDADHGGGLGHSHASALEHFAPPSVLVDNAYRILHLSPTVGRFFRPQEGPFSVELPAQVRPELRVDLKLALQRALEQQESSLTLPLGVAFNGERRLVAMHVIPTADDAKRALVFFLDAGLADVNEKALKDEDVTLTEITRLRQELSAAHDRLSASRREYEQATQDLRAANEELQSINEEYRSTAEELETSKEELQSMNEELQTVNGELKSKLETISASHNNLQNLIAATQVGTLFLDRDFRIRLFTPPITRYFAITDADVGRAISDFTHRLVYADMDADAASVLKTLVPLEKEIRTTDGQWLSMRMRPYKTLDNRIEGVVVTLSDVTKLKLAEEGLATELRAMERLQQLSTKVVEADRLDAPLEAILDSMILLLNADFGFIQLYDEKSKTLRIAAQRGFEQRFLERFERVDASSQLACGVALSKCQVVVFEDVEKEPGFAPCLEEARAAGYRAVIASPLCDSSRKAIGMLSIHFRAPHSFSAHDLRFVDICARLAADAINAYLLQAALREADRRKDEFLATLAHELRNPLASIHNTLGILKRRELPEDMASLRALLERQSTRLLRLVDDLLDVARITQGKIELRREKLDLNELLRTATEADMPQVEGKHPHVAVSLAPEPLVIDGDPMRLAQVFANLLHNAAKFTPPDGRIDVTSRRDGDLAVVSVRDDGCGIGADKLPRVFDPVQSGPSHRR